MPAGAAVVILFGSGLAPAAARVPTTRPARRAPPPAIAVPSKGSIMSVAVPARRRRRGLSSGGVVPIGTTGVVGQASEDEDGFTGNWSLTVGAICANPVAGLQIVTSTGVSDSVARKQKIASCPSGKQLTGLGGAIVSSATGQVRLESFSALSPFGTTANGANIIAAEDETGLSANWAVDAYAICANPLPGQQLVSAVSAAGSPGRQLQSASCPSGKRAVGIGAQIQVQSGGFGQVGLDTLLSSPLGSPPTAHVAFASEDQNGFAGTWTLTSQAICANT
jgi:hypothetical protein